MAQPDMPEGEDAMEAFWGKNPRRPEHPDLWRISQVLYANDVPMDQAAPEEKDAVFAARVGKVVDMDSLMYMAEQRMRMMFGPITSQDEIMIRSRILTLMVDAFVTGAVFQAEGGHQDVGQ